MKKCILLFIFIFNISICNNSFSVEKEDGVLVNQEKQERQNNTQELQKKNEKKEKSSVRKIFNKYIFPEKNPVFLDKENVIGIFGGYHYDKIPNFSYKGYEYGYENCRRNLGQLAISYSRATNLGNFHGRISIGLFSLFGNDIGKNYGNDFKYNYKLLGVEVIQEQIFGTDVFYVTIGAGISYMFWNRTKFAYPLPHNSLANFVLTASAGHRFNNGVIVELAWKHYSNGELRPPNRGINAFGLAIRYAFN